MIGLVSGIRYISAHVGASRDACLFKVYSPLPLSYSGVIRLILIEPASPDSSPHGWLVIPIPKSKVPTRTARTAEWVPRRASRRARLRRRRSTGYRPGQSQRGRRLEERRAGRPLPLRATPPHSVVSLGVHHRVQSLAWLSQPRARASGREGRTEESSCKRALAPGPPLSSQLRPPRQRPPRAVLPWQVARGTSAPGTTTATAANPARGCA